MPFPVPGIETAIHSRVLASDPIAPVEVYRGFVEAIVNALRHDFQFCSADDAYDSAIEAILAYLESPESYDPTKGRLSTYLMDIGKKRAIDRCRSRAASARRDENYATTVELRAVNPMDSLEAEVNAAHLWRKVEEAIQDARDLRAIELILAGERSTEVLCEALELGPLSIQEQRCQVKQHRDRLLKVLKRLGARLTHDTDEQS